MPRDYWGFGNPTSAFGKPRKEGRGSTDTKVELPIIDTPPPPPPITYPELKQMVYRSESEYSTKGLQELLNDGWKVVFATPFSGRIGIIEYILEKYV